MTAKPERFSFARRVLVAALVVLAVFGVAALVWMSARVLLLAFGGVLLGVLLDGLASALARRTPLSRRAALPVVVVGLVGLLVGLGFLVGPQLSAQMGELGGTLSGGLDALRAQMERSPLLHPLLDALGTAQENSAEIARRMAGVFATMMGGLGGLAVIVFIGVYLAADPGLYQRGVLHLVRKRDRARGQEVLSKVGHAIRSWVLGQFISMCFVGVMVTVGLLVIGVPIPLALGLIAFLLEFIPYVGPLAAFVPIVLVALAVSPQLAVYAIVLYGVIQFVESYLILPLVHQRVVDLPPALLLFFQVLFGTLGGVLGVAVSAPLAVALIVLVQMLYVEDLLGDDVEVLGEKSDDSGG